MTLLEQKYPDLQVFLQDGIVNKEGGRFKVFKKGS